jgi:hypothetical protein
MARRQRGWRSKIFAGSAGTLTSPQPRWRPNTEVLGRVAGNVRSRGRCQLRIRSDNDLGKRTAMLVLIAELAAPATPVLLLLALLAIAVVASR